MWTNPKAFRAAVHRMEHLCLLCSPGLSGKVRDSFLEPRENAQSSSEVRLATGELGVLISS